MAAPVVADDGGLGLPPRQSLDLRTLLVEAKDKVIAALTDALTADLPPQVTGDLGPGPKAHIRYDVLATIHGVLSETVNAIPAVPEDDPDTLTLQAVEGDPIDPDRLKRQVAYLKQCNRHAAERLREREQSYGALLKRLAFHDAILNLLKGRLYHELCLLKEELFRTRAGFSERSDAFLHDILMLVDTEAMLELVKDDEKMAAMLREEAKEAGEEATSPASSPRPAMTLKTKRELEGLKDQYRRQRAMMDNGGKRGLTEEDVVVQVQAAATALTQAAAAELADLTEAHEDAKQQLKAQLTALNEGLAATLAAEGEALRSEGRRETDGLQATIEHLQGKLVVAEAEAEAVVQEQRALEQEHARRISERDAVSLAAAQRALQAQCVDEGQALKQKLEDLTLAQAKAEEALAKKREGLKAIGDILQRTLAAWRESRDTTAAAEQELGTVRTRFLPVVETLRECERDSTAALRRLESLLRLCHSLALPAPLELPAGIDLGLNDEEMVRFEFLQMMHQPNEDPQEALRRARAMLEEVDGQAQAYGQQFRTLDQRTRRRQQQLLAYGQRVKDVHQMLQQLLSAAQRMPTPNLYARLMAYVETLRLRSELWAQSLGAEDSVTRDRRLMRDIGEGLVQEFAEFIATDPSVHRPTFKLDFSKLHPAAPSADAPAAPADAPQQPRRGPPTAPAPAPAPGPAPAAGPPPDVALRRPPPTPPRRPSTAEPRSATTRPPSAAVLRDSLTVPLASPGVPSPKSPHLLQAVSDAYGGVEALSYRLNIEEMAQQVGPVQAALWATEYAADHFPLALNTLTHRRFSTAAAPPDVTDPPPASEDVADETQDIPGDSADSPQSGPALPPGSRRSPPARPRSSAGPTARPTSAAVGPRPPTAPARVTGPSGGQRPAEDAAGPPPPPSAPVASPYQDLLQEIAGVYGEDEADAYRLNIEEVAQQVGPVQATIWATEYAADHFPLALNSWAERQPQGPGVLDGGGDPDSSNEAPSEAIDSEAVRNDSPQSGPPPPSSNRTRRSPPTRPRSSAGPAARPTSATLGTRPPSAPARVTGMASGRGAGVDPPEPLAWQRGDAGSRPASRPSSAQSATRLPALGGAPAPDSEEASLIAAVSDVLTQKPPPGAFRRRSSAAVEGAGSLPRIGSDPSRTKGNRSETPPLLSAALPTSAADSRPGSAHLRSESPTVRLLSFTREGRPEALPPGNPSPSGDGQGGSTPPRPAGPVVRPTSPPTANPTYANEQPTPVEQQAPTGMALGDSGSDAAQWVAAFEQWTKWCLEAGNTDPVLQRELASAQEEMTTLLALKGEAERDGRWEEAQGLLATIRRAEGLLAALYPALGRLSPAAAAAAGRGRPASALRRPVVGVQLGPARPEPRPASGAAAQRLQGRQDTNRLEVARWYGLVPPASEPPRPLCSTTSIRPAVSGDPVAGLHTTGSLAPPFDSLSSASVPSVSPPRPRMASPLRRPSPSRTSSPKIPPVLVGLLETLGDIDARCTTLEEARRCWQPLEHDILTLPTWYRLEARTWLVHARVTFQQRVAQRDAAGRTLDTMVWADKGVPVTALPVPSSPPRGPFGPAGERGSARSLLRSKSGRPQTATAAPRRPVAVPRPASAPWLSSGSSASPTARGGPAAPPLEEDNALSDVSSHSTGDGTDIRFTVVHSAPARAVQPFHPSWPVRTGPRRPTAKRVDADQSPPLIRARVSPKRTRKEPSDSLNQLQTLLGSLEPIPDPLRTEKPPEPNILRGDANGRGLSWEARTVLCHAKAASEDVILPACFTRSVPFCPPGSSRSPPVRLAPFRPSQLGA